MALALITSEGKFDLSAIMREAWTVYRNCRSWRPNVTFADRLRQTWEDAKRQRRLWATSNTPKITNFIITNDITAAPATVQIHPAPLSAADVAWIARQCSTDGRLAA